MEPDLEFEKTDAGSSMFTPISAGSLKNGTLVMIKDFPCKVSASFIDILLGRVILYC